MTARFSSLERTDDNPSPQLPRTRDRRYSRLPVLLHRRTSETLRKPPIRRISVAPGASEPEFSRVTTDSERISALLAARILRIYVKSADSPGSRRHRRGSRLLEELRRLKCAAIRALRTRPVPNQIPITVRLPRAPCANRRHPLDSVLTVDTVTTVHANPHTAMTIRESTDAEGPVVLVDTVEDFELAIATYDLPIIVPETLADELGFPRKPDDPAVVASLLDPPLNERGHKTPS